MSPLLANTLLIVLAVVVVSVWLTRKIKRSLWRKCPRCKGSNRGGRGLLGAYDHCPHCDGGEIPSAIGKFFGVQR